MAEMNPLRRRMIEDMQVRNLSPVTQRRYVHAVAKFGRHFNRSPDRLGLEEVRAYQIHSTRPASRGRLQSRGLRPALLLRRHARPHRDGRTHSLCTQAPASCR